MRSTFRSATTALVAAAALILAGCSAASPSPAGTDPGAVEQEQQDPCYVGTWSLDVEDYGLQTSVFLEAKGIPITEYLMTGTGLITFSPDGLVITDIELLITGTIVAGDQQIPIAVPSGYTGSGDWAVGGQPDTLDISNWANVPDAGVTLDPDQPGAPQIDFTDIPKVSATCRDDELILQGPEAPFSSRWLRQT